MNKIVRVDKVKNDIALDKSNNQQHAHNQFVWKWFQQDSR